MLDIQRFLPHMYMLGVPSPWVQLMKSLIQILATILYTYITRISMAEKAMNNHVISALLLPTTCTYIMTTGSNLGS